MSDRELCAEIGARLLFWFEDETAIYTLLGNLQYRLNQRDGDYPIEWHRVAVDDENAFIRRYQMGDEGGEIRRIEVDDCGRRGYVELALLALIELGVGDD
jgi:hypothetical protein